MVLHYAKENHQLLNTGLHVRDIFYIILASCSELAFHFHFYIMLSAGHLFSFNVSHFKVMQLHIGLTKYLTLSLELTKCIFKILICKIKHGANPWFSFAKIFIDPLFNCDFTTFC